MKKILFSFFAILLLLFTFILFLLLTTTGLKTSLLITNLITPYHIKYEQASGILIGPLGFKKIEIALKNRDITANNVDIHWELPPLLFKKINISSFNIDNLTIRDHVAVTPKLNKQASFDIPTFKKPVLKIPTLKWAISIKNANIEQLQIMSHSNIIMQDVSLNTELSEKSIWLNSRAKTISPTYLQHNLTIKGTPSLYNLSLILKNNDSTIEFTGQGSHNNIDLSASPLSNNQNELKFNLKLAWQPYITWDLKTSAKNIPISFTGNPKNILNFNIDTKGNWQQSMPTFTIDSLISTADTTASIKGNVSSIWDLSWSINNNNLNTLWPSSHGKIEASGHLSGAKYQPTSTLQLTASNLITRVLSSSLIEIANTTEFNPNKPSNLTIEGSNVTYNHKKVNSISLSSSGILSAISSKAEVTDLHNNKYTISAQSAYKNKTLNNTITELSIDHKRIGKWNINKPATLQLNPKNISLSPTCVALNNTPQAVSCISGNWKKNKKWNAEFSIKETPTESLLSTITALNTEISSNINVTAQVSGTHQSLETSEITASLSPGSITTNNTNNKRQEFSFNGMDINSGYKNSTLTTNLNLNLSEKNVIAGHLILNNFHPIKNSDLTQSIKGSINANINNINLNGALLPYIDISQGRLLSSLDISGTIKKPSLTGAIELNKLSLSIPKFGLNINKTDISLNGNHDTINYKASITSGENPLILTGSSNFSQPGWPTELDIIGDNVNVYDTDEYKINTSPTLHASISHKKINLTGTLIVLNTTVRPKTSNIITIPNSDIDYIGKNDSSLSDQWEISGNIDGTVGKEVYLYLDDLGIKGNLSGAVTLLRAPKQDLIANGEVTVITGEYQHFGNVLTIEPQSSITFTNSPITNPNLNIRGSKQISTTQSLTDQDLGANKVTVGMKLTGTIKNPVFGFFSIPATLSDSDIISYLVLGHSLENTDYANITDENTDSTMTIFDAIRLSETTFSKDTSVSQSIERKLGISELGVESSNTTDAIGNQLDSSSSFVVGKYLSKNIYLRYSSGLNDPYNTYQIRYYFSPKWMLQASKTSSSTNEDEDSLDINNGIDLLYTFSY